jgi:hypothetical protein
MSNDNNQEKREEEKISPLRIYNQLKCELPDKSQLQNLVSSIEKEMGKSIEQEVAEIINEMANQMINCFDFERLNEIYKRKEQEEEEEK